MSTGKLDEITLPFPIFKGATFEVCEWILNLFPSFITAEIIYEPLNEFWMTFLT